MSDEALIREAMQAIGTRGIPFANFCGYLGLTDAQARELLHEMSHRNLAGFAGGWVSPAIHRRVDLGDLTERQPVASEPARTITRVWRCREERVERVLARDATELAKRGYGRTSHEYADGRLTIKYELHGPTTQ